MKFKNGFLITLVIFSLKSLLFANLVYAEDKEKSLLSIQAKLYPRIVLFDKSFKKRLNDGVIDFVIIANKDNKSAKKFKKMIEKNYPHDINKIPINIRIHTGKELFKDSIPTAIYFYDDSLISKELVKLACKYKIPSFGYSTESFKSDALITIEVLDKVKPLINKKVLKNCSIPFLASFLKLARIYD